MPEEQRPLRMAGLVCALALLALLVGCAVTPAGVSDGSTDAEPVAAEAEQAKADTVRGTVVAYSHRNHAGHDVTDVCFGDGRKVSFRGCWSFRLGLAHVFAVEPVGRLLWWPRIADYDILGG